MSSPPHPYSAPSVLADVTKEVFAVPGSTSFQVKEAVSHAGAYVQAWTGAGLVGLVFVVALVLSFHYIRGVLSHDPKNRHSILRNIVSYVRMIVGVIGGFLLMNFFTVNRPAWANVGVMAVAANLASLLIVGWVGKSFSENAHTWAHLVSNFGSVLVLFLGSLDAYMS